MNRKVIVFGATGNTGIQICEQLHACSIPHAAFVRCGSENKMVLENTELIVGDALQCEDIENAFKTNEFTDVVICLGSRDLKKTHIRTEGSKNIVDVLNKLSIKCKIHVVSALGAGNSWSQLNWFGKLICKILISNTMNDHTAQEAVITKSSHEFHIVRPVGLTDGKLSANVLNQTQGLMPSNQISRADVALYLVESMLLNKTGFSSICTLKKQS